MAIRLMIADDHAAIRAGVISLIQGTEIEMVCQSETCDQTVKYALACQPDVLLLDVQLAGEDGLMALEQIKRDNPKISVLIFSVSEEVKDMALARKLGADGYVYKGTTRDNLLGYIRRAAMHKSVWAPRQIRQVVSRGHRGFGQERPQPAQPSRSGSPPQDHDWAFQRRDRRRVEDRHRDGQAARKAHPSQTPRRGPHSSGFACLADESSRRRADRRSHLTASRSGRAFAICP